MALVHQSNLPPDGMRHPADEAEVAELILWAREHGRHVRVRGAGHSPAPSFARDDPADLIISLDRMRAVTVIDEGERLLSAQAGIHLGVDPSADDDSGGSDSVLLDQIATRFGWTVSSLGGITHQTLGGFLATCSAGGSAQHSFLDHVVGLRLVDGHGEIREFSDEDPDGPGLAGVLPSLGLLGVIVSVTLRCMPVFTIVGQEAIVDVAGAPFDLEGPGDAERPSLADFLTRAEYVKIEWWPQRGAERFLVWQAQQAEAQPGFRPTRYEEFTRYPLIGEALFSTLFVVFGNRQAPARVRQLLRRNADEVARVTRGLEDHGAVSWRMRLFLWSVTVGLRGLAAAAPLLRLTGPLLEASVPWFAPAAMNAILPLDTSKPGMRAGEPQSFRDWAWEGMPMDNQANDVLLWTQFIELWVPLRHAAELVRVVRAHFAEPAKAREAYERTGLYAYELYAAPPAVGWIHPAHSDGADAWADGALRLDIFWFQDNLEDPREEFFPQFWRLLSDHGIVFRSHWGKELPLVGPDEPDLAHLSEAYPHLHDWLALRADCDPDGVFLTDYWADRLGLGR